MDLGLQQARAIVTGGSSGLGLAIARGLLTEVARVALVARDETKLNAAADDLRSSLPGADVLVAAADTTKEQSVRAMVDRVVSVWGGVDVLVNAAAQPSITPHPPALADLTDSDVLTDFDTKVMGYLRTARAVGPVMMAQGWGRIVNISGLNARRTGSISGTVRNVAVAALTANLADELGPHGVGVTVVHPGQVETDRTPSYVADRAAASGRTEAQIRAALEATTSLHRLISPEEVADVVVFLCSRRAVAVTGDAVSVGGGNRGSVHY